MKEKLNFDCIHSGYSVYIYDKLKLFNHVVELVVDYITLSRSESGEEYIIYTLRDSSLREIILSTECLKRNHSIYSTHNHSYVVCTSYQEAEGRRRKSLKRKIKGSKKQRQYYINKRKVCDKVISANDKFISSAEESVNQKNNYII